MIEVPPPVLVKPAAAAITSRHVYTALFTDGPEAAARLLGEARPEVALFWFGDCRTKHPIHAATTMRLYKILSIERLRRADRRQGRLLG